MKKIINYIKTNKVKSLIGLGVILSLLVVFISFSLAEPTANYSFTYNSTGTNNNYSNNDPGSFSLTKKVEWIGHNKLKVTMTVNTKPMTNSTNNDILLVVDTSSFLDSDMLSDLKSSLTSVASYINGADSNSKVGIIEFNSSYTKYDFTNNLTTINNNIDSLTIGNNRSYYQAFTGIDDILTSRDTNRDLKVIFITTGLSNINKSGDLYRYNQLVDKYNIDINCIYYLTNKVLDQPHTYFSNEIVSSKRGLEVNIESLSMDSEVYKDFTITDHYDTSSFSIDDLNVYNGSSQYTNYGRLEGTSAGTIKWIMEDSDDRPFYTGSTAKLEYELNYTGGTGNYSLNSNSIDVVKTIGQTTNNFTITDNLVVGNSYNVTYNSNVPSGCSPSGSFGSSHKDVYEAVTYPADPKCEGYKFKGWKVVTTGVKASKNGFIMPAKDVEVKATWSKVSVVKSMSGDVKEIPKAYDLFEEEAEKTNGVVKDYDTFFAGEGYSHQDAYNGSGDKKIYFFRAEDDDQANTILNMNNVIFANHCWQMLRTTDTGGIKMIYNGEPEVGETGHEECQTDRGRHVGYNATSYYMDTLTIATGTVYYGSNYTYDKTNNRFSLSGTITSSSSWSTNYNNLIGKYTCNSTSADYTCSALYLIESYKSTTVANVLKLELLAANTGEYSQFGKVPFNRRYNSPADVGYMYNMRYIYNSKNNLDTTSYWFGGDYEYKLNETTGRYEYYLVDTGDKALGANDDISEKHYTCWSTTQGGTCEQLSYVFYHEANNKTMYYINLSDNRAVNSYLDEMLNNDNVNRYDSTIKLAIDKWYEHYILPYPEYTSKLENAVFCNNRSIKSLGGWSPTGSQTATLDFKNYEDGNSNLSCSNLTDRFSADTNNTKANLKYPVGLMSASEMNLLNSNNTQKTEQHYWLGSPYYFNSSIAHGRSVYSIGFCGIFSVDGSAGLRPAISLAAGVKFTSGDGSMSEPYRVD